MITPTSHILSSTKEKYFKFKSRLEKSISTGRFQLLSRRKKNSLISKVEKFRTRLERLNLSPRGATVAGSVAVAAMIPTIGSAQIDPNFNLQGGGSVPITNANDVAVANIDADEDIEFIFTTSSGGEIAQFDGKDGYTTSNPNSLTNAIDEIFAADLDGDGDTDLIFTNSGDGTYIYKGINNGSGYFTSTYLYASSVASDVDLVDWDSDGDLDVVTAGFSADYLEVFENDGSGNFTSYGNFSLGEDNARNFEFADMDNDGDMDLIHVAYENFVPYNGSVYALENTRDGAGVPIVDTGAPSIIHQSKYTRFDGITTLDFDGDGDLDVFFHRNYSTDGYARRNNYVEGSPFTFTNIPVSYLSRGGTIEDAVVADFDFDGDDDLIVAGTGFNRMLIYQGGNLEGNGGDLGGEIGSVYSYFTNIAVGDFNGDDNLDLIGVNPADPSASIYHDYSAPYISSFQGSIVIDENTPVGTRIGTFTFDDLHGDPISASFVGPDAGFFDLDDVTGEWTLASDVDWETTGSDLAFELDLSDGVKSQVFEATVKIKNVPELGNGTIEEEAVKLFGTRQIDAFAPGDSDLDGDQDLFASSSSSSIYNTVFQQNGGSFADDPLTLFPDANDAAIFLDGYDGRDLVVHDQTTNELRFSRRDGASGFSSYSTVFTGLTTVHKMITGDFDGDRSIELAVHAETSTLDEIVVTFEIDDGSLAQNQYFQMSTSSASGILDGIGTFNEIAIGDFDGDGFDDLLAATTDGDDVIFFGGEDIGGGNYGFSYLYSTAITQADGGETEVEVGDFDGDGTDDIAIFRWQDAATYLLNLDIHINDGSGNFSLDQSIPTGGEYAADLRIADMDGDGAPDIVATNWKTVDLGGEFDLFVDLEMFINDGTGTFSSSQLITEVGGEEFELMDVDGDDDLDIVLHSGFGGGEEDYQQLKVYENINVPPTSFDLSSTSFDEHSPIDTEIATASVVDPNPLDQHSLSLAEGDGSNDLHNNYFITSGTRLILTRDVAFEDTPQLNVYLAVSDGENTLEQAFVLDVNDVNQAPTGISLSTTSFDEGTVPGSEVATLTAVDPNAGDSHEFELAVGDGANDADNGSFVVDGDKLIIVETSNFETKASYNVYLSASDIDGSVEQAFTLNVNDVNQAPTAITLSNDALDEGTTLGTTIATVTVTDPNAGDTHDLSLATGDGTNDADNGFFVIGGSNLILIQDVDFDENQTLNILISADDGEEAFEQAFTLTVNDALGLADETRNVLGIYPNPGQNKIQLNIDNNLKGEMTIRVTDLGGKVVEEFISKKTGTNWARTVDMTSAEPGIYMVHVSIGQEQFVQRWIKN